MLRALVVDDDDKTRLALTELVGEQGFSVMAAGSLAEARGSILEAQPDIVLLDLMLPDGLGLDLIADLEARPGDPEVVVITGHASLETAVEALRRGASDYLTKPIEPERRKTMLVNLARSRDLRPRIGDLRDQARESGLFGKLVGSSEPMQKVYDLIGRAAPSTATVLVTGESGTGKELVAKALHYASPRRAERFLAINCGAIPSDILESELFGHERGAFTGAVTRKIGKFELAHQGTMFLDEISELYPELQVKLLRVLEERQIMRVGGAELLDVDFRLIAATNRDLDKEVAEGRFREDLYYRLKVVTLGIPPLRARPIDVPLLVEHFLTAFCEEHGKPLKRLSPDAAEVFTRYPWPGNVRELKNRLESLVIFHRGEEITLNDLPAEMRDTATVSAAGAPVQPIAGGPRTMAEIERQAILETLRRTNGHRARAADLLDIGLRTLQRKLKDYKEQGFYED